MEVLEPIPVQLSLEEALTHLRIGPDSAYAAEAKEAVGLALSLAHPRAVYELAYVEERDGDRVNLGGVWFTSHVLRRNLEEVHRAFPRIVTIGGELEKEVAASSGDLMRQFQLDALANRILGAANRYLHDYLVRRYGLGELSGMNPGSLPDWPLPEQRPLFSLFGDVQKLIGVRLTEDFLMIPRKSTSGIYFPTEVPFVSCQLCPMERCSGRKAPYDPKLVEEYSKPI